MMMTLKKGDLFVDQLRMTLHKISMCNGLDSKVAYNFMRLVKILEQELKKVNLEKIAILKKYVEPNPEKPDQFKLNEEKTDFLFKDGTAEIAKKELEEFAAAEVTIARCPFEIEAFAAAKLTPAELGALEFMIYQPEE